jgi:hypothetical protein
VATTYTNAAAPTAAELRRNAIYNNYRALVDANKPTGGYGTLYGPNIDINGGDTLGEGKIAGTEAIAFSGDESGTRLVTVMVQIPASFSMPPSRASSPPRPRARGASMAPSVRLASGASSTAAPWPTPTRAAATACTIWPGTPST